MNVAVDKNLQDVREGLKNKGYNVVDIGEKVPIDAIVYINNGTDEGYSHNEMYNSTVFTGENIHTENGAFMVNAHGKSVDEIDQLLKKRSYSPLFQNFY